MSRQPEMREPGVASHGNGRGTLSGSALPISSVIECCVVFDNRPNASQDITKSVIRSPEHISPINLPCSGSDNSLPQTSR